MLKIRLGNQCSAVKPEEYAQDETKTHKASQLSIYDHIKIAAMQGILANPAYFEILKVNTYGINTALLNELADDCAKGLTEPSKK